LSLYIKISKYFTINKITTGFFIAFLSAGAMYLDWLGFINHFINTLLGLLMLYWLIQSDRKVWFWSGFGIGALWFWWISMSFSNYGFPWAIPFGVVGIASVYGLIFYLVAKLADIIEKRLTLSALFTKAFALLVLSYLHPMGFDWFKPELIFTNSYLGIEKWQFAITLIAITLTLYKKQLLFLLLIILAYPYNAQFNSTPLPKSKIVLSNSNITVQDKWNPQLRPYHIDMVFKKIDRAIHEGKDLIIFPESIFAFFLNEHPNIMTALQASSNEIAIVIGGLYLDYDTNRNSTYIFKEGKFQVANKSVLVPFGEQNPLPKWMGNWINEIFFDGAPDYVASPDVTDYTINGVTYRNAICFEGTSEELYKGDPKQMILISNNGWVSPSIEPTQQKILLQYYSKKYGTTIYHSVNMSPSYVIHNGEIIKSITSSNP